MSYARWIEGDWYVFWSARDGSHGASAVLCVWHVADEARPEITYAQALDAVALSIIGGGADDVTVDNLAALVPGAPREAIGDLIPLVLAWMRDVEAEATCPACGRFVAVVRDPDTQDVRRDHSGLACDPHGRIHDQERAAVESGWVELE